MTTPMHVNFVMISLSVYWTNFSMMNGACCSAIIGDEVLSMCRRATDCRRVTQRLLAKIGVSLRAEHPFLDDVKLRGQSASTFSIIVQVSTMCGEVDHKSSLA